MKRPSWWQKLLEKPTTALTSTKLSDTIHDTQTLTLDDGVGSYSAVTLPVMQSGGGRFWITGGALTLQEGSPTTPHIDANKLAVLKVAEPHKVTQQIPDLVEVITGWRCWGVHETFKLESLGQDTVWEPHQILQAECSVAGGHRAPQMNCTCGIWAFKELDALVEATVSYDNIAVLGQVSLWGRVVETENGWRAERAYPRELWILRGGEGLEELGYIYDIPIRIAS